MPSCRPSSGPGCIDQTELPELPVAVAPTTSLDGGPARVATSGGSAPRRPDTGLQRIARLVAPRQARPAHTLPLHAPARGTIGPCFASFCFACFRVACSRSSLPTSCTASSATSRSSDDRRAPDRSRRSTARWWSRRASSSRPPSCDAHRTGGRPPDDRTAGRATHRCVVPVSRDGRLVGIGYEVRPRADQASGRASGGSRCERAVLPRRRGADPLRRPRFAGPVRATRSTSPIGSCSASAWRSTCGSASASGTRSPGQAPTCSAWGRSTGPGSGSRPDGRRARSAGRGVRVPREAGRPVLLLPRPRRRAGGPDVRRVERQPGRHRRRGGRTPGAHRACASCGARPTSSAIRATRPARRPIRIPRSSPTPRPRSRQMLEVDQAAGRHELHAVGRPRGLRDAAQHGPRRGRAASSRASCTWSPSTSTRIGFEGTLLIEPKPMEPTKHQYDYDTRDRPRLPRPQRPRGRVPGEHRGQPRHARRPQLPSRGRLRHRQRRLRQHRRQPGRLPERLGHGPVPELGRGARRWRCYEILRGGGFTTGGFNFDAKLRRQSMARDDLFHAHIGGIDTLARALLVAAEMLEAGRLDALREARYAGWTAAPRQRRSWAATRRSSRWPTGWPQARSTRGRCPVARRCSKTSSTSTSGPSTVPDTGRAPAPDSRSSRRHLIRP